MQGQPDEIVKGALASCSALVNMSESESFGIVLLEAWICKRPVVVNKKCLAFSELVQDRENGYLCDDVNSLSCALIELLADPQQADEIGRNGYMQTAQKFEWKTIAENVNQQLLQTILKTTN